MFGRAKTECAFERDAVIDCKPLSLTDRHMVGPSEAVVSFSPWICRCGSRALSLSIERK
jgi:hypothetical protein